MTFNGNPLMILDGRCTIHVGDVMDRLRDLADESVDTVITSPPYWGLRDYGTAKWVGGDENCDHRSPTMRSGRNEQRPMLAGSMASNSAQLRRAHRSACGRCGAIKVDNQIGLEASLSEHVENLVCVFREIRRVLKSTGSCFVNYGDCYATEPNGRSANATKAAGGDNRTFRDKPIVTTGAGSIGADFMDRPFREVIDGFKAKDLCFVPNILAAALRADGWWLRSEIIWGKKNPMPDSSGQGRPSTAHEKIFLLTKSAEADVWRARDTGQLSMAPDLSERCELITPDAAGNRRMGPRWLKIGSYYDASAVMQPSSPNTHARVSQNIDAQAGSQRAHAGAKANGPMKAVTSKIAPANSGHRANSDFGGTMKRTERIGQKRGLPPRLEEHINHTGLDRLGRGAGRLLRNYEGAPLTVWPIATVPYKEAHFATFPPELVALCIAAGAPPDGGMVLDPFGGSGTTALVALRMGRRAQIIELNPEYVDLARQRLEQDWMGEDERRYARARELPPEPPGPLFEPLTEAAE